MFEIGGDPFELNEENFQLFPEVNLANDIDLDSYDKLTQIDMNFSGGAGASNLDSESDEENLAVKQAFIQKLISLFIEAELIDANQALDIEFLYPLETGNEIFYRFTLKQDNDHIYLYHCCSFEQTRLLSPNDMLIKIRKFLQARVSFPHIHFNADTKEALLRLSKDDIQLSRASLEDKTILKDVVRYLKELHHKVYYQQPAASLKERLASFIQSMPHYLSVKFAKYKDLLVPFVKFIMADAADHSGFCLRQIEITNFILRNTHMLAQRRDAVALNYLFAGIGDAREELVSFSIVNNLTELQEETLLKAYFGKDKAEHKGYFLYKAVSLLVELFKIKLLEINIASNKQKVAPELKRQNFIAKYGCQVLLQKTLFDIHKTRSPLSIRQPNAFFQVPSIPQKKRRREATMLLTWLPANDRKAKAARRSEQSVIAYEQQSMAENAGSPIKTMT